MRFLSQRNTVIAAATLATGGLVFTALAVSASASSDDLTRSNDASVVVGSQLSGPSASSPSDYPSHEGYEHGTTSPTSTTGSHEASEHRNGHDSDDAYEDDAHEDDTSGRHDDNDDNDEESRS